jgi:hypothetical protein
VRLVAYVHVSREDERPQIVEVVRNAAVSGALPLAQRRGGRKWCNFSMAQTALSSMP